MEIIISKNYKENRPWGAFTVLEEGDGYKVKRLTVNPGHSTSLQFHKRRSEHWIVVQGTATVTLGKETKIVSSNEYIYIPLGNEHLLENKGELVMQLIEVQIGDYLEEDDIVRLKDKYGRIWLHSMKSDNQMAFDGIPSTKLKAELLSSKAKQDMVEMGGRISQILGLPRSTGQIFGLLYFSSNPLSMGDICEMLGISKASTSTGARQLAAWGAIRKVWIPGERRDYYEAVDDLVQLLKGSYRTLIKPRVRSSNNRIKNIEDSLKADLHMQLITKDQEKFMNERIDKIKKLHGRITKVLPILERLFN